MAAIFGPESGTTTAHIQVWKYNSLTHYQLNISSQFVLHWKFTTSKHDWIYSEARQLFHQSTGKS